MTFSIIKKTVTGFFGLLLSAGLSTHAFSASKEIVTDSKERKVSTVIAQVTIDPEFKTLDVDADGKISLKEAIKDRALAAKFNVTDANSDGEITAEEYALYVSQSKEKTEIN